MWASDLPAFVNQHPSEHWIVGTSQEPALSAEEAQTMAENDAAGQIAALVRPGTDGSQLVQWIDQNGWIADRDVSAKERPYGTIWKASVLIDASPEKLAELGHRLQISQVRQHIRTAAVAIGSMVWFSVIGCFYLMSNWITRGYFRGRLALISMLLVGAGIAGMMHLL